MHTYLMELLQCPSCHGELTWTVKQQGDRHIEAADAECRTCAATYPVRNGIGIFLLPDLPRRDLWEQVDSQLRQYLREHPEVERQLMESPLDTLAPADQFFRTQVLEERGEYADARTVEDLANVGLYTAEYLACWDEQVDYLLSRLAAAEGPIVDLASGRGYLIERLARNLTNPIVATDFSPWVLRRNRAWLEYFGWYERVSLLAFDARRTPFKDRAVVTLTTNLGLPNIEEPGSLLEELRRIVSGGLLAISHFFPEVDDANAQVIRDAGLATLLYRRSALACFARAGWRVEVVNRCLAQARPTPAGVVLQGARIDGLPAADTTLEWCVLSATSQASGLGPVAA
jgi:uncharacterized protein YbaR (Trm112 family)